MGIRVDIIYGNGITAWSNFIKWCQIDYQRRNNRSSLFATSSEWKKFLDDALKEYNCVDKANSVCIDFETEEDCAAFLLAWG